MLGFYELYKLCAMCYMQNVTLSPAYAYTYQVGGEQMGASARRLRRTRLFVLAAICIMAGLVMFVDTQLRPTLQTIAEARAKVIATHAINDAINTKVAQDIKYGLLITVHTDHNGRPAWAQVNTMEVNRIVAATTTRVQDTLEHLKGEVVSIPLGQAFASPIMANFGPRIPFTLVPVGTVNVEVTDAFESAGINQTRHKIYLEVFTDVQIIIPFITKSIQVHSQIPIADVTYLGDVPQTVVNLPFPIASSYSTPRGGERSPGTP